MCQLLQLLKYRSWVEKHVSKEIYQAHKPVTYNHLVDQCLIHLHVAMLCLNSSQ